MNKFGYLRRLQLIREGEGTPTSSPTSVVPQVEQKPTEEKPTNIVDPNTNPWENPTEVKDPATVPAVAPATTAEPAANSAKAFQEHMATMDFTQGLDFQAAADKMRDGDMTGMQGVMNDMGRQVFQQAVMLTSEFTKQQVEQGVAEALQKSKGSFGADLAQRELQDKFPAAKDPTIAPVANGVFARYLERGQTVEEAIKNTENYFANMANKFNPPNRQARPGQGGFNKGEANSPFDDQQDETDFFAALSQGSRTRTDNP